ncbi:hypothetical protein HPP92_003715 [Vanilla planifolia]|uniref:2-C-methyl-D-erythritol 4-phosphate cytidylyltransferase, chloroplastic n=1 Tax=Vanilla planifolia TaxID=51239 RepID=A0A835RVM4_VANPL|nr:hypothetical protein HPP92_003715 [Vanilla planifolia]
MQVSLKARHLTALRPAQIKCNAVAERLVEEGSESVKDKSVSVLLLAGGKGKRMGVSMPKQYLSLLGKPIALYSLFTFSELSEVKEIVVVCEPSYQNLFEDIIEEVNVDIKFALPGKERQDSVFNGLQEVDGSSELVCIHDSARPLVLSTDVRKVLKDGWLNGAAVLGVPVKATIKEANKDSFVTRTFDRKTLWEMQTPQVIKPDLLRAGFELVNREGLEVTDDASIVEYLSHPVYITEGSYTNIKVTTPDDLLVAEILKAYTKMIKEDHWKWGQMNEAGRRQDVDFIKPPNAQLPWSLSCALNTLLATSLLLSSCSLCLLRTGGGQNSTSIQYKPTVVNVGALFTLNSTIGRVAELAIKLAVDDVNENPSVLAGTRLRMIVRDTNCSGFLGTIEALQLMANDVVAIIGPQSSGVAHIVSEAVSELNVPLLSFAATDPTLSSSQYPYFLRTTQSDYFQMNAVADMIDYFGWREVIAIFVDDDYGRGGISVLGDALALKRAKISYKAAIPPNFDQSELSELLVKVNLMESRVYVVHANPDSGLTGQIRFNSDGDLVHPGYDILNIAGTGLRRIGFWSNSSGLTVIAPETLYGQPSNISTYSRFLYDVIWPGETTMKPRGWVFPDNGKMLRIGIPNRASYKEFVSKDTSPDV